MARILLSTLGNTRYEECCYKLGENQASPS